MSPNAPHFGVVALAAAGLAFTSLPGVAAAVELTVQADARDALIIDDAPRSVTVSIVAEPGDAGDYELRQTFIDRYGEATDAPAVKVTLGERWQQRVEAPVEHFGPATYRAALYRAGEPAKPIAEAEQMLVRPVPLERLSREERAGSPMGINVHRDAHWETLAAMGIHWARDYSWGWLKDGKQWPAAPNGTQFGSLAETADRAGITILPIMQQAFRTPDKKFFIDDTDAIAEAYERLSKAVPEFAYWELDNEADLVHNDQTTDDYRRWYATYLEYIRAADRGLKAAGHGAQVVLNGEAGIHPERTRDLIEKVGDHFAVVNYHFYTGTVAPEQARHDINTGFENRPQGVAFLDQLREINQIAHEAGKEAWLTEIGWSARTGPAVGDRLQSAYFSRMYLLARWAGTDKTFWFWDRELEPTSRFSSTEFVHMKEGARAVGAASAAVSKFTALAEYAGSIDIGPDRWALAFRSPEGKAVVAAWSVESEYDLPSELAAAGEAFDMYGNPLRDRRLTAEPAYFVLDALPPQWEAALGVEWLSPQFLTLYQGDEREVRLRMPADARLSLRDLPEHVRAEEMPGEAGDERRARLSVSPRLAAGAYEVSAVVEGDGWVKRFPVTLNVRPAVDVVIEPYTPGEPTSVTLANRLGRPIDAVIEAGAGGIEPQQVSIEPNGSAAATFTVSADATEPIEVCVTWEEGATQAAWARPRYLAVPRAEGITIDGDISEWPTGGKGEMAGHMLRINGSVEDFAPRMRLAWSPEGLYLAAEIPVGEGFTRSMQPEFFWEWTSVEMNMNAADAKAEPGVERPHLLWFTPTRDTDDSPWRVYAGEWQKLMPDGSKQTLNDDRRSQTAMAYDGQTVTIEALIPVEVLGTAPQAGHEWPLTIHAKIAKALSPRTLGIWPGSQQKGRPGWGRVRFEE